MRWIPNAVSVTIGAITLYFALLLGVDAFRIFTSPFYGLFATPLFGLDGSWQAQIVYGIGRVVGLEPHHLLQVAAFFGGVKLTAAVVFAIHIAERLGRLLGYETDHEILEGGLLLFVLMTGIAMIPALVEGYEPLIRVHSIHLLLAGVVAVLSAVERSSYRPTGVSPISPAEAAYVDEVLAEIPPLAPAIVAAPKRQFFGLSRLINSTAR